MQTLTIYTDPIAKGRPRIGINRSTGRAMAFTPSKTVKAEASMRALIVNCNPTMYAQHVPITVEIRFFLRRPDSLPKRILHPAKKPDIDNLLKTVSDAANGVLWWDDAQIVSLTCRKAYCAPDERPRIEIEAGEVQ